MGSRSVLACCLRSWPLASAAGCGSDGSSVGGPRRGRAPTRPRATRGGTDAGPRWAARRRFGDAAGDASLTPGRLRGHGRRPPGSCLGFGCRMLRRRATAAAATARRRLRLPCVHVGPRGVHGERELLQPELRRRDVRAAQHDVQDARQPVRGGRRVLLEALLERDVPGLVVLRSGGGRAARPGSDCCTGTCTVAAGATLGTCGANPPSGPANCGVVDGQLCGGTASDGGVVRNDAGLPACGGPCCSRACAPWGPTGVARLPARERLPRRRRPVH